MEELQQSMHRSHLKAFNKETGGADYFGPNLGTYLVQKYHSDE